VTATLGQHLRTS